MRTPVEEAELLLGLVHLTKREIQCVQGCADGLTSREIGKLMNLSESTIKNHISSAIRKAGVHSRTHLVAWCFRNELIR